MLETLSLILEMVTVSDLINFARVSRRMREMVYDDTRWVRRLRLMGCWSEAVARARGEDARRKMTEAADALHNQELKKAGIANSTTSTERHHLAPETSKHLQSSLNDGFDAITLSPATPELAPSYQPHDASSMLDVISRARSIRGAARHEYGRIHGALAPLYKDAIHAKHPSHARIFRIYRDPVQQAQMLAQLIRFARSDLSQGWQSRENKLAAMVAAFEDAVSREFDQGLKLGDVDGRMKKYAHVLVTLNGGQRAIQRFISENSLITESAKLGDPMDCVSPNNVEHVFLEESHAFFTRLAVEFNAQVDIIDRVFPAGVDVVVPFLKMIGTDVIAKYLTTIFSYLQEKSSESYVKIVSGTYDQSLRLAKSLQPTVHSGDNFYEAVDQMVTDNYVLHAKTYFAAELASFKRRSEIEVNSWERQLSQQDASLQSMYMTNINRQADKRDFLSSFKKVVMMPVNVLPSFPVSTRFGGKTTASKALVNGDGPDALPLPSSENSTRPGTPSTLSGPAVMISRTHTPIPEPPTTELAAKAAIMKSRLEGIRSLFSLEVALNLVHMAKASIERTAIFAKIKGQFDTEARNQCETIFILLLKTLGVRHVKAGFDQAVEHLSKHNPRAGNDQSDPGVAPLIMFLELVNVGDLIQQMIDVFYEQELVATKLTDRNDFLNPTAKEKKRFEQMLDERVAAGLNKGIEVLMAEVDNTYATTQNVEDFNPGATGMVINSLVDITPSNTAIWVVEMISAHTKMLVGSTDKNILDVFNQEVGLRLFTALCKHLKRQRVSVAGSVRLIR